jgi:hypothetical protein
MFKTPFPHLCSSIPKSYTASVLSPTQNKSSYMALPNQATIQNSVKHTHTHTHTRARTHARTHTHTQERKKKDKIP